MTENLLGSYERLGSKESLIEMMRCKGMGHEGGKRNAHKVSLRKPGGNIALPRPRQKGKDDFKIVLTK